MSAAAKNNPKADRVRHRQGFMLIDPCPFPLEPPYVNRVCTGLRSMVNKPRTQLDEISGRGDSA